MNNLIVTIIGIALTAVAAIMGVMYVGTAFQQGQSQAWANAMMNQNQQLMAAANMWSLDHGGDIWSNVRVSALVNQKYLSEWPNMVMLGPQPNGNAASGQDDHASSCPVINGYQGDFQRALCTLVGQNTVTFTMVLNDPYNGVCGSSNPGQGYGFENAKYISKHPFVQLALAANKMTGAVPSSATIAGSGLPYAPTGSASTTCAVSGGGASFSVLADGSGNPILNYCYLAATSGNNVRAIYCSFTQ